MRGAAGRGGEEERRVRFDDVPTVATLRDILRPPQSRGSQSLPQSRDIQELVRDINALARDHPRPRITPSFQPTDTAIPRPPQSRGNPVIDIPAMRDADDTDDRWNDRWNGYWGSYDENTGWGYMWWNGDWHQWWEQPRPRWWEPAAPAVAGAKNKAPAVAGAGAKAPAVAGAKKPAPPKKPPPPTPAEMQAPAVAGVKPPPPGIPLSPPPGLPKYKPPAPSPPKAKANFAQGVGPYTNALSLEVPAPFAKAKIGTLYVADPPRPLPPTPKQPKAPLPPNPKQLAPTTPQPPPWKAPPSAPPSGPPSNPQEAPLLRKPPPPGPPRGEEVAQILAAIYAAANPAAVVAVATPAVAEGPAGIGIHSPAVVAPAAATTPAAATAPAAAPALAAATAPATPTPRPVRDERPAVAASAAATAPAVAARAAATAPAVAAGPAQPHYTEDFFRNFNCTDGYKQHNQAVKWFRNRQEIPADPFSSPPLRLPLGPFPVATVVHGAETNYNFDMTQWVQWDWREMVAQLRDEDLRFVVGCGLQACEFSIRAGSYDIGRHYHNREQLRMRVQRIRLPVWDFVLFRSDGTGVRLHPHWGDRKVDVFDLGGHPFPVEPSWRGLGQSLGPGTFQDTITKDRQRVVRFDARKDVRRTAAPTVVPDPPAVADA